MKYKIMDEMQNANVLVKKLPSNWRAKLMKLTKEQRELKQQQQQQKQQQQQQQDEQPIEGIDPEAEVPEGLEPIEEGKSHDEPMDQVKDEQGLFNKKINYKFDFSFYLFSLFYFPIFYSLF